jgi:hypothetical protein
MPDTSSMDAALLLLPATLFSLCVSARRARAHSRDLAAVLTHLVHEAAALAHGVRSMHLRRGGRRWVSSADMHPAVRNAADLRPRRRAAHADGLGADIRSHTHHTRTLPPSLLALRPRLSTAQISAVTCAVRRRVQALRASNVAHVVREIQCDAPYTSAQLAGIVIVLRGRLCIPFTRVVAV